MRAALPGVGFCLMVATMLHSVATGNILPASIPLVCVDINPATVTKLADRGSSQARGIVTDVGLFLEQLAMELVPDYRRTPLTANRHFESAEPAVCVSPAATLVSEPAVESASLPTGVGARVTQTAGSRDLNCRFAEVRG